MKVQMVRLLMPHLIEPRGQVHKVHEGGIKDWLVVKYQGTLRIRSSNVDPCRKYFTASTVNSDQITPISCFRVWKLMETHSHISLKPSASNWLIRRHSFCKANCHLVVDSTVSNVAATRNWGVIISGSCHQNLICSFKQAHAQCPQICIFRGDKHGNSTRNCRSKANQHRMLPAWQLVLSTKLRRRE